LIVELERTLLPEEVQNIQKEFDRQGYPTAIQHLYNKTLLVTNQEMAWNSSPQIADIKGVVKVHTLTTPFKLASSSWKKEPSVITFPDGDTIGNKDSVAIMAGPCSVETEEQIFLVARKLAQAGIKYIRGGAYKPRTSPYSFQGLGLDGLKLIRQAADENGLKVITEVLDTTLIEEVYQYADILQIGSRNMQNFYFLKVLGKTDKPLMLKRGMYSRIDEWLMAAEYLLSNGNDKVMLCERGIRTFDTSVRNTMDITAIPLVNELSHLPIIADPSHGTGKSSLIIPMTLASIAAGADGIMVEVHPDPKNALSDGEQSLNLNQIDLFLSSIDGITGAMNKNIDINIKIN